MKKIFFMELDIAENISGLELSALTRSTMFTECLRIEPIILTVVYNRQLRKNFNLMQANRRVATETPLLNMYDYFQETVELMAVEKPISEEDFGAYRRLPVADSADLRFYDDKGEFVAYCKRNDDDRKINFINYLNSGIVFRREIYDSRGFLSRVDHLNTSPSGEASSREFYLRVDGSVALIKDVAIKAGVANTTFIQLLRRNGSLDRCVQSDFDLTDYFFEEVARNYADAVFIVDRCAEFYEPIKRAITKTQCKASVIPIIHNVHTVGDVFDGAVSPFYKSVLEDIYYPHAVIVFTEQQKTEITQRFGNGNVQVIPHSHEPVDYVGTLDQRQRKKIVYLARYAPEKQHTVALQILRRVVDKIPDVELHLYGFGEKKTEIENQVKTLRLEGNVYVNDFTRDAIAIYRQAGLSILTSSVEGFCMGVMESLFCGCPVVSFDIRYGPNSMIKDGLNGFLVKPGDIDMFAEKVISILSDEILHRSLIESSASSMVGFLHRKIACRWEKLLSV